MMGDNTEHIERVVSLETEDTESVAEEMVRIGFAADARDALFLLDIVTGQSTGDLVLPFPDLPEGLTIPTLPDGK